MVSELKELTSALTTPEMQKEIQELKEECARYTERLKNIKAATNHVTPEEKEKVRGRLQAAVRVRSEQTQALRPARSFLSGVQRQTEVL